MIEDTLLRIAVALEAIAASKQAAPATPKALKTSKMEAPAPVPAPESGTPAPEPAKAPQAVKIEDIRTVAADLIEKGKKPRWLEVLASVKATKIGEIPEAEYANVLAKLKILAA